ncbi:non-hydrolyzing UDP-N-acetylglucosamine 2-epimerase [Falsiroseomonas selenitidurans]|uniref:UDP-N-acetylglucosamine 2-epimerase (non-hydrolyzing) n=1 Tax=Falsiroseomonas selenitidurans TaxID=2716335 RepID=A0ABX1E4Y2_9PROT|nr:UDP-N-acetylglucosamine 2-epimerase (non-hydrolyzing) [Falsiroseomonas selenitidurans]NKC32249.1 UDP-N-acetylglucosamine 2-epimerase (non-hydrolyzing) [Falsiroseomonas selenitidurans]
MSRHHPGALTPDRPACRVLVAFGTRPEAIKMMPVLAALRDRPGLLPLACSTGQHHALVRDLLAEWHEAAAIELGALPPGLGLPRLTSYLLTGMAGAIAAARPDLVLVQGDTLSAFAAALAAHQAGIAVGHVEAGLRSGDLRNPWPEEFHRVSIDAMAALRFAPNATASANLRAEYGAGRVIVTGNTGIDALFRNRRTGVVPVAIAPGRRLILVTAHRRENWGAPLAGIAEAVAGLAARGDVELVWPLHPNPAVREAVTARLAGVAGVHLLPPLPYGDSLALMQAACLVLTDSGGMQEEAPALGRPVLVLREVTERPEVVEAGAALLVGTAAPAILAAANRLLDDPALLARMSRPVFPYGDGRAAGRIADAIGQWWDATCPAAA